MTTKGIEFKFLPQTASHMAGVLERFIGSVKRTLDKVLYGESLKAETTLRTIFAEAESIVNSKPDRQTPNHFLIGPELSTTTIPVETDSDTLRQARVEKSKNDSYFILESLDARVFANYQQRE